MRTGIAEGWKWKTSLETPRRAPRFYAVISVATLIGHLMNFLRIDPVKALVWAAVLNRILAAPLMAIIMAMASSRKVMGKFEVPSYLLWTGWVATAVMASASAPACF